MRVSASFLSSWDKSQDLKKLNLTDVDYIHVDYMDGKFVSNKSLPFRELKKVYKYTSKRLDVHLMSCKPDGLVLKFAKLNTEFISIHVEINRDIFKILKNIRSYGIKAGLDINPDTELEVLVPYLDDIDLILVMSVYPGLGGQEFLMETEKRVLKLKKLLKDHGKENIIISVDGGINADTCKKVLDADIVVCGNYITSSDNFQERINMLR